MALYAKEQSNGRELKPIIVAYDMRFLSPAFADFAVLASNGIEVWFMKDPSPTPMVMRSTGKGSTSASRSASHNPQHYNGVKVS